MRVVFITAESLVEDPIINTQVQPLVEAMEAKYKVSTVLITRERHGKQTLGPRSPHHIPLIANRMGLYQLKLVLFLMKNRRNFDVIHLRGYLAIAPVLIGSVCRRGIVFDPRGLFVQEWLYKKRNRVVARIFALLEKLILKCSSHVIAVSNAHKEHLISNHQVPPSKISVITTFSPSQSADAEITSIDREFLSAGDQAVICYSGSAEKWQCIDRVIQIFQELSRRNPKLRFLFLTTQPGEIKAKIQEKISEHSYLVKSVRAHDVAYYLNRCDYGVLIREETPLNNISAPIKLKDYLAAGLRVVASRNIGDLDRYVLSLPDETIIYEENIETHNFSKIEQVKRDNIRKAAYTVSSLESSVDRTYQAYRRASG